MARAGGCRVTEHGFPHARPIARAPQRVHRSPERRCRRACSQKYRGYRNGRIRRRSRVNPHSGCGKRAGGEAKLRRRSWSSPTCFRYCGLSRSEPGKAISTRQQVGCETSANTDTPSAVIRQHRLGSVKFRTPAGVPHPSAQLLPPAGSGQPSQLHRASPITSSRSRPFSQGSSSVNKVTHCRHEQGVRVMSVPQNIRAGPKASKQRWRCGCRLRNGYSSSA